MAVSKKKKRAFLVEDDMPTVDIYKTALQSAGFEVIVANFGSQALKIINQAEKEKEPLPDIVLLDLILPDINGIEVLKEIRRGKKTKDISVLVLSNYTGKQLGEMGYSLGSEKFLLKTDFTPSQIAKIIEKELT